ncbi:hypothetical protein EDC01DRAFT_788975 [Geopyxis carbonaria]|nr:hypothetical protein EDC01DRAFT_788975 [Geopyxis carbonaria]
MKLSDFVLLLAGVLSTPVSCAPVEQEPKHLTLSSTFAQLPASDPRYLLDTSNPALVTDSLSLDLEPSTNNTDPDPSTDTSRYSIIIDCDTTTGSPRLHEVDKVIAIVKRKSGGCHNSNFWGSHCTRIASSTSGGQTHASISVCGTYTKIGCWDVGEIALRIKKHCAWTQYAGGTGWISTNNGGWVVLHH